MSDVGPEGQVHPTSSRLQVLASFWGPEQMQMLANHGISLVVPWAQKYG